MIARNLDAWRMTREYKTQFNPRIWWSTSLSHLTWPSSSLNPNHNDSATVICKLRFCPYIKIISARDNARYDSILKSDEAPLSLLTFPLHSSIETTMHCNDIERVMQIMISIVTRYQSEEGLSSPVMRSVVRITTDHLSLSNAVLLSSYVFLFVSRPHLPLQRLSSFLFSHSSLSLSLEL